MREPCDQSVRERAGRAICRPRSWRRPVRAPARRVCSSIATSPACWTAAPSAAWSPSPSPRRPPASCGFASASACASSSTKRRSRPTGVRKLTDALRDIDQAPISTIHSFAARLLRESPVEAGDRSRLPPAGRPGLASPARPAVGGVAGRGRSAPGGAGGRRAAGRHAPPAGCRRRASPHWARWRARSSSRASTSKRRPSRAAGGLSRSARAAGRQAGGSAGGAGGRRWPTPASTAWTSEDKGYLQGCGLRAAHRRAAGGPGRQRPSARRRRGGRQAGSGDGGRAGAAGAARPARRPSRTAARRCAICGSEMLADYGDARGATPCWRPPGVSRSGPRASSSRAATSTSPISSAACAMPCATICALRERWQQAFDYLLVDEFQDTDPLQAEIVLFLAEDGAAGRRLAQRRAQARQAVRRRRPKAVHLSLPPCRHRHVRRRQAS